MTMTDDNAAITNVSSVNASVSSACDPCNTAIPDDTANTDDRNSPFGNGWVEITDEELPPDFLKPTPTPAPQHEQLQI